MLLNNQMDKQGPKCNCAVTQQLDLLSPSSSSLTDPSSGGPCSGLSRALTGEAAWGHFVSFQFGFIFSLEGSVGMDRGRCRVRGRGHIDPSGGG